MIRLDLPGAKTTVHLLRQSVGNNCHDLTLKYAKQMSSAYVFISICTSYLTAQICHRYMLQGSTRSWHYKKKGFTNFSFFISEILHTIILPRVGCYNSHIEHMLMYTRTYEQDIDTCTSNGKSDLYRNITSVCRLSGNTLSN